MRITASFALLLALANFKSSSEMAVIKGLGSQPETKEDCSGGETSRLPEAANVRTKNPETDLLNDADLTKHQPQDFGSSGSAITKVKEKRCVRREPITISDRVGSVLSLTRRDVNLEKLKQRCENCRNSSFCKKLKMCTVCKTACDKAEAVGTVAPTNIPEIISESSTTNAPTEIIEPESTIPDGTILGSRFGVPDNVQKPRYYTLGNIEPGPLLHLFVKTFNIPGEENFEKLVILGKLRGEIDENLDNLLIIDMANAFGNDKQTFATVHRPININPTKISELDRRLTEALERRKQELNTDQLSNDQIHDTINRVLEEMAQKNTLNKEFQDQFVQLPETETKCSVDEAVNELLEIIPMSAPERHKEEIKPQQIEEQEIKPQQIEEEEIKPQQTEEQKYKDQLVNPPVIQDGFDLVGRNLEDGWVDDNGEAGPNKQLKPKVEENIKKPLRKETDPTDDITDNVLQDILSVSGDIKHVPESDNQINEPDNNIQSRINSEKVGRTESLPENNLPQNVLKSVNDNLNRASEPIVGEEEQSANLPAEPEISQNIADNVLDAVKNGFKLAPNNLFNRENVIEEPSSSPAEELSKSIFKTVEDGFKVPATFDRPVNKVEEPNILQAEDLRKNNNFFNQDGQGNVIGEPSPNSRTSPAEELSESILKTVEDGFKVPSTFDRPANNIGEPNIPQTEDLRKNILQTVEDSLKIASNSDNLQRSDDIVEESAPIFVEDLNQADSDNTATRIKPLNEPAEAGNEEMSNNEFFETPDMFNKNKIDDITIPKEDKLINVEENDKSSESMESEENINTMPGDKTEIVQNLNLPLSPPFINDPTVGESLTDVSQFSDESSSKEKLSSFGSLVPLEKQLSDNEDSQIQKLYFVGKDIKLPLQMYQDKDGIMQLRVDIEKLCHCKNQNCTRKHSDNPENANTPSEKEEITKEENNKADDNQEKINTELMNSFVDHPDENTEIFKRSPKMEPNFEFDQQNNIENDNEKLKTEEIHKFQEEEEKKLEEELKKINDNLKEYFRTEKSVPVNKGNVALYKEVEKTKDVGKMISLANNLLIWMKDLAINNLNS